MEELRSRFRWTSIIYYLLSGISLGQVIVFFFIEPILGFVFCLYTTMLFFLGMKGYELASFENKHLVVAYLVMSSISLVFNFIWGIVSGVFAIVYPTVLNIFVDVCFILVGLFSCFTSFMAWKYYKYIVGHNNNYLDPLGASNNK